MPLHSPGGLRPQQNADVLAFILRAAKFPAGQTELTAGPALNQVSITAEKPQ